MFRVGELQAIRIASMKEVREAYSGIAAIAAAAMPELLRLATAPRARMLKAD
jgi:hypothetical protein